MPMGRASGNAGCCGPVAVLLCCGIPHMFHRLPRQTSFGCPALVTCHQPPLNQHSAGPSFQQEKLFGSGATVQWGCPNSEKKTVMGRGKAPSWDPKRNAVNRWGVGYEETEQRNEGGESVMLLQSSTCLVVM
uniref:Uncharacterized protein n=1 Tax=Eutreptiella gymnastica TaxID=73025 RepID=A0A7S4FLH5_9EUGL